MTADSLSALWTLWRTSAACSRLDLAAGDLGQSNPVAAFLLTGAVLALASTVDVARRAARRRPGAAVRAAGSASRRG